MSQNTDHSTIIRLLESRFDGVDRRLDSVDTRLDKVERRADNTDDRLAAIGSRVDDIGAAQRAEASAHAETAATLKQFMVHQTESTKRIEAAVGRVAARVEGYQKDCDDKVEKVAEVAHSGRNIARMNRTIAKVITGLFVAITPFIVMWLKKTH